MADAAAALDPLQAGDRGREAQRERVGAGGRHLFRIMKSHCVHSATCQPMRQSGSL